MVSEHLPGAPSEDHPSSAAPASVDTQHMADHGAGPRERQGIESWHLLLIGVALLGFGLLNALGLAEPRSGPAEGFIILGRLGWTPTLLCIAAGAWLLARAHRL